MRGAIGNLHQDDVFIRRILENQHSSVDQPPIHSIREVSLRRLQQSANSEALEEVCYMQGVCLLCMLMCCASLLPEN